MSLAVWEFFWDEADWVPDPDPPPPPPPPPAVPSATDAGGGKSDDHAPPADFWEVREAYLRSLFEKVREIQPEKPVAPPPADEDAPEDSPERRLEIFFPRYTAELGDAVSALRLAESSEELKKQGTKIVELMAGYQAAKRAVEEENSKREAAYRIRQAERLAKKKAAIAAARLLLKAVNGR